MRQSAFAAVCLLLAAPIAAQQDPPADADAPSLLDLRRFTRWFDEYRSGAFRLAKEGRTDEAALAQVDATLGALARWNTLPAGQKLFDAASVEPELAGARSSTDRVTFYRELQPWKVREVARRHLVAMTVVGLDEWLVAQLHATARADADAGADAARRDAAMRVLAARGKAPGLAALLRASRTLPGDERVKAVNALSQIATVETVEHFMDLLRDREPNVRIAALNALGKALAPLVDETRNEAIDPGVAATRDQILARCDGILKRDKIWQVRAAAAENLARMRCKQVIPVLIAGLDVELKRKQDPWAMDMKIHRLLERLTGQTMPPGMIATWKDFWRKESGSFRMVTAAQMARLQRDKKLEAAKRYSKFFTIDVESDRLLFVLDFSGSMAEPVTLKSTGTSASPQGRTTTKAKLVVEELKKIVMSLADGTRFNIVVFSDEVRIWREAGDNRPALVELNDETRDDLLGSYLDALAPAGPTNLYGALDAALDFNGRALYDKYYRLAFDTMYILSDGAPSYGKIIDREQILAAVRQTNGLRRMTIHTVTFGDKNETAFLKTLAEENGGRHIHVE